MIVRENFKLGTRRYVSNLKMFTGWPSLIALVDIFFLLLWFFAQSGSYTRLSGITVELPKVKAPTVAAINQEVISIMPGRNANGEWLVYFGSRHVELSQLQEELAKSQQQHPKTMIAILADRRAPYELVAQVMAMVGNVGLNCFLPVMPLESHLKLRYEK